MRHGPVDIDFHVLQIEDRNQFRATYGCLFVRARLCPPPPSCFIKTKPSLSAICQVHARLRKANEELYLKRAAASERDKAKRAAELGLIPAAATTTGPGTGTVVANGTADTATPAPAPAPTAPADSSSASNGNGNGSRAASPTPGATGPAAAASAGAGADGAAAKGKGKGKKGKGKAAEGGGGGATLTMEGGGLLKVNPKVFEPDRGQVTFSGVAVGVAVPVGADGASALGGGVLLRPLLHLLLHLLLSLVVLFSRPLLLRPDTLVRLPPRLCAHPLFLVGSTAVAVHPAAIGYLGGHSQGSRRGRLQAPIGEDQSLL